MHSLAVGKKREKKEESIDPANERRIV